MTNSLTSVVISTPVTQIKVTAFSLHAYSDIAPCYMISQYVLEYPPMSCRPYI